MKKNLIVIMAAAAVLASACQKEQNAENLPPSNGDVNTTVILLAAQPETAKTEVASDGKISWVDGDAIAVYNSEGAKFRFVYTGLDSEGRGKFECGSFSGELGSVAVYPYQFAGETAGTVTIPKFIALEDVSTACMVMASKVEAAQVQGQTTVGDLHFKHLFGMVELTLQDIPAYATALKIRCDKTQIAGDFSFDPEAIAPISAQTGEGVSDIYFITFPYKTGYGAETKTVFHLPLPVKNYGSDLNIIVLGAQDGGDKLGDAALVLPSGHSDISAGKYLICPTVNVRAKVGTARDKYTKVAGVKWAKSNLRAWANAGESNKTGWQENAITEGFQDDWGLYANPWDSQYALKEEEANVDGTSKAFTLNKPLYRTTPNKLDYYAHFDYFSWATLGRAARVHNQQVTSTKEEFDICGKVFQKTDASGMDISKMTVLEGDARFVNNSPLSGSNSTMFGDLAFWASKGQYRMPNKSEIYKLFTNSDNIKEGNANLQAGYYMDGKRIINGILYTTVPFWKEDRLPTANTTAIELTLADIESGLFLPKAGERTTNTAGTYDSTSIKNFNAWGIYWSGTYGGINGTGYDDCARTINWVGANTANYGYTIKFNNSIIGNTAIGNCIRPVLVE